MTDGFIHVTPPPDRARIICNSRHSTYNSNTILNLKNHGEKKIFIQISLNLLQLNLKNKSLANFGTLSASNYLQQASFVWDTAIYSDTLVDKHCPDMYINNRVHPQFEFLKAKGCLAQRTRKKIIRETWLVSPRCASITLL